MSKFASAQASGGGGLGVGGFSGTFKKKMVPKESSNKQAKALMSN